VQSLDSVPNDFFSSPSPVQPSTQPLISPEVFPETSSDSPGEIGTDRILEILSSGTHPLGMKAIVLHDSEHFKILNFNLKAGALFPIHSHDLDGQLSILVIEGEGLFLAENEATMPANTGDMLISDIREPHGVKATTDMRIVVTIAPPI